ncbi:phosphatase domain-containing putative toxin [Gymnodinialimonas sp.]
MSPSLPQKIAAAWAVLTHKYDQRIDSALGRWQGQFYAATIDHGWLRRRWTNEGQIAEGLYRSNHPNAQALARWKARGVRHVISLRPAQGAVHAFEVEACAALGLTLMNAPLTAREAPRVEGLLRLLDMFDRLPPPRENPVLIHCKSGADRTGLAAALWAIHVEGKPVAEAQRALTFRHLHIRASKTGVLDRFLEAYAARLARGPIDLRAWVETEYDPANL